MICPFCESPHTYIKINENSYGCRDCDKTGNAYIGYGDPTHLRSPTINGTLVKNEAGDNILVANSNGIIVFIPHGTDNGFGRVVGFKKICPVCHSGRVDGRDDHSTCLDCGSVFTTINDEKILFQFNCVFPLRDDSEFYRGLILRKKEKAWGAEPRDYSAVDPGATNDKWYSEYPNNN